MVIMTTAETRSVRHADDFKEEFRKLSDAAIGVFLVRTREPHRAVDALQDVAIFEQMQFRLWTCVAGWQDFPNVVEGREPPADFRTPDKNDASTIELNKAFKTVIDQSPERSSINVMFYLHPHFDKLSVQQYIKDIARKALSAQHRLVILAPEGTMLKPEIEDDVYILDFKLPSHAELVDSYSTLMTAIETTYRPEFSEEEIDQIVQNAVGMTTTEFETALSLVTLELRGKFDEGADIVPQDYIDRVLQHKVEALKKTDILELVPSVSMSEVGGFDALKSWMRKRAKSYSEEAKSFGIAPARGVLCVGPPGSGKSLFAKASAAVFGTPLVKLDIGKVFGRYVGESEQRIRSALSLIEAMAPCVLFLDEIDKGFGGIDGGGGDSGTSKRVLGTFLTWMQERDNNAAPVLVVATANNVQGLPAELLRKGRFDEIFACTFPDERERIEILVIHLRKRGHRLDEESLRRVAQETDKYVGSELEAIVADALVDVFDEGRKELTAEDLIAQAKAITPLSTSFADKVNFMVEWAKNNAKPASSGKTFDKIEIEHKAAPGGRKLPVLARRLGPVKAGKNLDN